MKYTIDPNKQYTDEPEQRLFEATGLLPWFAADVAMMEPKSVQEAWRGLMECYGFGDVQSDHWGTVEDGVYKSSYKEDPDLSPLATFTLADGIEFLVFEHAITAVTDGTETIMGRMD